MPTTVEPALHVRQYLNVSEVAAEVDCSSDWVRARIDKGELPAYRLGNLLKVKRLDLADFIRRCRVQPVPANDTAPAAQ